MTQELIRLWLNRIEHLRGRTAFRESSTDTVSRQNRHKPTDSAHGRRDREAYGLLRGSMGRERYRKEERDA